jgi:predicted nucleotidyltransferase
VFEGEPLLRAFRDAGVELIVVGGVAATAQGSSRVTMDLDLVYRRTRENVGRLVAALAPSSPYLRGAPPGLPFRWDEQTVLRGLNFTLTTSLGDVDLLGEITGGGRYEDLLPHTVEVEAFGVPCRCLGLEKLIAVKRAAGRPKDLEAVAELEAIWEERRKLGL